MRILKGAFASSKALLKSCKHRTLLKQNIPLYFFIPNAHTLIDPAPQLFNGFDDRKIILKFP